MQVETPLPSPNKIQVDLPSNSKKVNGVNAPSTSSPKSEEKNGEDGELTNGEFKIFL